MTVGPGSPGGRRHGKRKREIIRNWRESVKKPSIKQRGTRLRPLVLASTSRYRAALLDRLARFRERHHPWLERDALHAALAGVHGEDWRQWPAALRQPRFPAPELAARHRLTIERYTVERTTWRVRNGLSLTEAAAALGMTTRTVSAYGSGERPVPRYIVLACKGWEAERRTASPKAAKHTGRRAKAAA